MSRRNKIIKVVKVAINATVFLAVLLIVFTTSCKPARPTPVSQETQPTADKETADDLLDICLLKDVVCENEEERLIVAYNSTIQQADETPCISASGDNICELYENGMKICAANDLPFGTTIYIEDYGECVIMDRLNPKYTDGRIDIFMGYDVESALVWGTRYKNVLIVKNYLLDYLTK